MVADNNSIDRSKMVISYLTLRRLIGVVGMLLPLVLAIGAVILDDCQSIQDSISAYYHTDVRDALVGILWATAFFLFSYKGYRDSKHDNRATNLAGLCAIGISIFPAMVGENSGSECIQGPIGNALNDVLHFVFAAGFFILMAYISLCLFTKGSHNKRNTIYRICGYIMIACIVLIVVVIQFIPAGNVSLDQLNPVFWLETIALWAFGVSWLTKGKSIIRD